ncbi:hypothetical protein OEA41_002545 [Lepraria neglecta]|uniref:Uncharacterized protein n=1 Tax=Lepraria neglecta TaxID=209136 RepID=A0AAD9ZCL0_9LECA|nr:hypothetical protein OEA41_002545 [Lepraria neglecta]
MKDTDSPTKITLKSLQTHLQSYESHVPEKIQGLESLRLNEIPEILAQRKKDGDAFLEKTEVTSLVEWKLKHGTYRPNLAKLVASNIVKDVREITKLAFSTYEANNGDYAKSITALAKLKGIGPATASLLLSCYDPMKVPFFSDELYRYLHFEEAKSKGWDRKISYTMKEYKSLFEKLQTLRERLEKENKRQVSAIDIEKMAYVLGKEAPMKDPDAIIFTRIDDDEEEEPNDGVSQPPPKRQKKNTPKSKKPEPKSNNRQSSGRSAWGKKAMNDFEQKRKDRKRKAVILFGKGADDGSVLVEDAWGDRVAKDLGKAFHDIGMEEYEEWKRKGFKVDAEEFEDLSKEEKERLMDLATGIAMRVGSKRI